MDKKTSKILVVEDNLVNQTLYKKLLEKKGYNVLTADNGREAITQFITEPDIGLIIMDIQMPVLDGLETTRSIRSIEGKEGKGLRVPIIALTAYEIEKEECYIAGCDEYIMKPINNQILDDILFKHLKPR